MAENTVNKPEICGELKIEDLKSLMVDYKELILCLQSINNGITSLKDEMSRLNLFFQNGFKKDLESKIVECVGKHNEESHESLREGMKNIIETFKTQQNMLFFKLAGSIILVAGLFTLIVELIIGTK